MKKKKENNLNCSEYHMSRHIIECLIRENEERIFSQMNWPALYALKITKS